MFRYSCTSLASSIARSERGAEASSQLTRMHACCSRVVELRSGTQKKPTRSLVPSATSTLPDMACTALGSRHAGIFWCKIFCVPLRGAAAYLMLVSCARSASLTTLFTPSAPIRRSYETFPTPWRVTDFAERSTPSQAVWKCVCRLPPPPCATSSSSRSALHKSALLMRQLGSVLRSGVLFCLMSRTRLPRWRQNLSLITPFFLTASHRSSPSPLMAPRPRTPRPRE
mmetsp:Transcript_10872/g.26627  ORF Transcript_10872/g.26627 Transcript_10872/m.26627 type:complete len:227 (+) Transcript_10872:1129-1809(+)